MEPEELDDESNQRFIRFGAVVLKTVLVLFAVLAIYLVLFPICILLCYRFGWLEMDPNYPFLKSVVAPIEWLAKNCSPYESILNKLGGLIIP